MGEALGGVAVCAAIAVILAAVISLAVYAAKKARERTEALHALAAQRGLRWIGDYRSLDDTFSFFPLFQVGHSRRAYNVAGGTIRLGGITCETLVGDYQYKITTSNGKQTSTTTYTTSFIITRPRLEVPEHLQVRREGFFDKIGEFLGMDDIDFESSEFSKRFHVKCSDRRFAFDLFDPRMMEFFLAVEPMQVEFCECVLLTTRGTRAWDAEQFALEFEWVDAFYARVPRHVRAARLPESEKAADPVLNPSVSAPANTPAVTPSGTPA